MCIRDRYTVDRSGTGGICYTNAFNFNVVVDGCDIDDCCSITEEEQMAVLNDIIASYSEDSCKISFDLQLDTCDLFEINWGDGTTWDPYVPGDTSICRQYSVNGSYTLRFRLARLAENNEACVFVDSLITVDLVCDDEDPPSFSCIQLIDGEFDCTDSSYCFRVVNHTGLPDFAFRSIALINESPGVTFNPDPIGIPILMDGDTSAICLLYTSPSPRDRQKSRMPSSA